MQECQWHVHSCSWLALEWELKLADTFPSHHADHMMQPISTLFLLIVHTQCSCHALELTFDHQKGPQMVRHRQ